MSVANLTQVRFDGEGGDEGAVGDLLAHVQEEEKGHGPNHHKASPCGKLTSLFRFL